ncbi:MAG: acyl-CoA thioesterase domain-containing protein [Myxococcota bacterium]
MDLLAMLGSREAPDGLWRFLLGRSLHGAFGGVNGGVLAAAGLIAARPLAPGRVPAALDARFLRGFPGPARAEPTRLHHGRTLSCVSVDLLLEDGRLGSRATVSLVDPEALEPLDDTGDTRDASWDRYASGRPWPRGVGPTAIPLVETFGPRAVGRDERGIATALALPCEVAGRGAEAACIAADVSVGPPVARALRGRSVPIPNPDLSLRFACQAGISAELVGVARVDRIEGGLALTRIEVHAGGSLVATGVSSTTLLAISGHGAGSERHLTRPVGHSPG